MHVPDGAVVRNARLSRNRRAVRIPRNSDLIAFPTICWYEVEYSVYTMRQASRRSWRIGQRHPVRVVYFAYRGTLQAQALALVAKKLQAALVVEGELGEEGLASHGADGDDLTLELARSLTGAGIDEESLEALFADARRAGSEAEAALDERDVTPEPELPEWTRQERVLVTAPLGPDVGEQMRLL